MVPEFVAKELVLRIHELHLLDTGGLGGLRDQNLLDSALAQPAATFGGQFLHEDLFAMAAAYLFHLVMNHPFNDGNKRIGLAVALTFLDVNGYPVHVANTLLEEKTLAVAAGELGKEGMADFFRRLANTPGPSRLVE